MRWIPIILTFLSLSLNSHSSDVKFYSINDLYGISVRETLSICSDDNGFVWVSSKTGVLRIVEDDYRIYQLPYNTPDVVSLKLVYSAPRLIAFTNNGQLFTYNELYDRFDLLTDIRETLLNPYVALESAAFDDAGTLWMATSTGLYRYGEGRMQSVTAGGESGYYVAPYDGERMFYSAHQGMGLLDIKTLEYTPIYHNRPDARIQANSFLHDKRTGGAWIGTFAHGLFRYDGERGRFSEAAGGHFPRQPVQAIEWGPDSTLLVGIDGQGVWKLDSRNGNVLDVYKEDVDDPASLRGNGVYDILCSEDEKVWVATYTGGLSFFEQGNSAVTPVRHRVNDPNSLGNNDVNQIVEDSEGDIWFSTNNGISRWNPSSGQWDAFYQNERDQAQVFLALCEDRRGRIWAGSYSSGIYVLDRETGRETARYPLHGQSVPGNFIFDIYEDSQGEVWIGGVGEVACYFPGTDEFRSYPLQPVNSFEELSPGRILMSHSRGVSLLDKSNGKIETLIDGCLAHDIAVYRNYLWVATFGDGLIRYDCADKTVRRFTTDSGLASDYVNSVTIADGSVWIGTESGFSRLDLSDNSITSYSAVPSLSGVSFNVNSGYRLNNGRLIWGTNNGAVMVDPRMLYGAAFTGRIFFQDIAVAGRSIRENAALLGDIPVDRRTELALAYNRNNFSLELLPVGVPSAESRFSWILEGFDPEWIRPSNHAALSYMNIPVGNYRLVIRLHDNSLSHVIDERVLEIRVIPPYWSTWWFRLACILACGGILYSLLRIYINRLRQRHSEDKIRFFTGMAHDIRTSMTLIAAPIEELNKEKGLSAEGRYYLNLAAEQSGRLSSVATQLLDFEKADSGKGQLFCTMTDIAALVSRRVRLFEVAAKKKDVALSFSFGGASCTTAVDEIKIEKIVDNLISNAIKYSRPGGRVDVRLSCGGGQWNLEVRDNGLGISEQAQKKLFREFYRGDNPVNSKTVGSGIGLLLVRNYVAMHGGRLSVQSRENEGSVFLVTVPLRIITDTLSSPADQAITSAAGSPTVDSDGLETFGDDGASREKPRILLVEDNNDLLNFLRHSFKGDYKITVAHDGVKAWELIGKNMPDLVISDVMMPNMDGFRLCRLIKSTFETSHIPVILLTSLSGNAEQIEGLGLGADDYMTKPFDMSILAKRIESILRNRKAVMDRMLQLTGTEDAERPVTENRLNDRFVRQAFRVVQENLSDTKFGKTEFASAMNVSASLLYNKLKSLTGQAPVDFIKTIRINHAVSLLRAGGYTITEISELCGFASASYFSTVFKKHCGKSPSEVQP